MFVKIRLLHFGILIQEIVKMGSKVYLTLGVKLLQLIHTLTIMIIHEELSLVVKIKTLGFCMLEQRNVFLLKLWQ